MTDFRISVIVDPGPASPGIKTVEKGLTGLETSADRLRKSISRVFAGFTVAFLVRELGQAVDSYTHLQNRLRVVTEEQERLGFVTNRIFEIANKTRSAFDATGEVYSRVALSAKELGRSEEELLQFTESLNQAVIVSGASAQEASAGLIQLSQGIASGALRGDELRSVLEQLPVVADVIAKSLGVTRGELRLMGTEGKITADIVLDAFKGARKELEERFAKTIPTIGQSLTVLKNNFVQFIGELDNAEGASAGLSKVILLLANNIESAANAALLLGGGFAAIKLGPVLLSATEAAAAFIRLRIAVLSGNAVMLGSAEATRQQAAEELHAAEAAAEHTAAVLANTEAQAANALVVTEATAANAAREAVAGQVAKLEVSHAAAAEAVAVAQAREAETAAALGAVYTPHAATLGRLTVLEEEHLAATVALSAAQAEAAVVEAELAAARSVTTSATAAGIAASEQATANAVIQAATTKQLAALQVESAAATQVATVAQTKFSIAAAAASLKGKLLGASFAVNPFLILIAGATAAWYALKKLEEGLADIREAQKISEGGAKSGLTDFGKVGADIARVQGEIARVQKIIDQDGIGNAAATSRLAKYTAELERLRTTQKNLLANTEAGRAAAQKQREALAELTSEFAKSTANLAEEARQLSLSNREREIQAALFQRIAAIEKDGAKLKPGQKEALEADLRRNKALEEQAAILDALHGPQEKFESGLAAAKALLDANRISAEEFKKTIADLAASAEGVDLSKIALPGQQEGDDPTAAKQNIQDLVAAEQKRIQTDLLRAQVLREIKGPIEELVQREKLLEELHIQRTITDSEYAAAIAKVGQEMKDLAGSSADEKRAAALANVNTELNEQARLLGMNSQARAIEVELLRIEGELREKGIELSGAERAALEARLQQLDALELTGQILEDMRGPQGEYLTGQEALAKSFLAGAINIYEYAAALEHLRLKQEETAKSSSAFGEFTKGAFRQAGTAIVEFAVTGEDHFKEFTIGLLQDLERLLAQKALIALLDAFTGGGASAGTAFFGAFGGGKAGGGDVTGGKPYLVGEEGPEIFTPPGSGTIVPAGETAAVLGGQQQAPIVNVTTAPPQVNITNVTDPDEVPSGIESEGGQQAVLNVIRKHKRAVRGITG